MDVDALKKAGRCNAGCHPQVCVCDLCEEAAAEIDRLTAALATSEGLKAGYIESTMRLTAENDRLREALSSCESWIDRWSAHVGNCKGGDKCTCGRSAVLYEANSAINQQSSPESRTDDQIAADDDRQEQIERDEYR